LEEKMDCEFPVEAEKGGVFKKNNPGQKTIIVSTKNQPHAIKSPLKKDEKKGRKGMPGGRKLGVEKIELPGKILTQKKILGSKAAQRTVKKGDTRKGTLYR